MSARPRPLSPHLQVYRWQMTSVLSILHRGTGLFLVLGSVMIAFWVVALALSHNIFASYQAWLGSLLGKVLLAGWSFSLARSSGSLSAATVRSGPPSMAQ